MKIKSLIWILLSLLFLSSTSNVSAEEKEFLVKFKPNVSKAFIDANTSKNSPSFKALGRLYTVMSIAKIKHFHRLIDTIEPNYRYRNFNNHQPGDQHFWQQWFLKNTGDNAPIIPGQMSPVIGMNDCDINILPAWNLSIGSKIIKIAVIDTGVDYNHKDLRRNIWVNIKEQEGKPNIDDDNNGFVDDIFGYDFVNNDGNPMDDRGHGTHVAGIIGAVHNNIGIAGIMKHVSIVPIKFISKKGEGTLANAIKSIDYAIKQNVDIMSNSWGGDSYSNLLKEAIEYAHDAGIIFTAAAGNFWANNNDDDPIYPASYDLPNIISVGSHNHENRRSSFSCYGKKSILISAPGSNILSTYPDNNYKVLSGTSMSAPVVSGILGLLIAKEGRTDFDLLKQRIINSAIYVPHLENKNMANGRIDAFRLLSDTK